MTSDVNRDCGSPYMVVSSRPCRDERGAGPVIATVDPADIRGLGTTLHVSVGRLPRSRHEGRPKPPPNALEGCAKPGPRPSFVPVRVHVVGSRCARKLFRDRPHERQHLAGDRGDDDVGVLAAADQAAIALAESKLGLPGDGLDRLGQPADALLDLLGDLGRIAVGPGPFDQGPPDVSVAGFGNRSLASFWPAGVLAGNQADKRRELARGIEPGKVADLCDGGDGDRLLDSSERHQGLHQGLESPPGELFEEFSLDPPEPLDQLVDGAQSSWKTICCAGVGQTTRAR